MKSVKREVIKSKGYSNWTVEVDGMLICPCGYRVEDDGECPEGHTSPLVKEGLI